MATLQRWLNYTSLAIVVVDATVTSARELDFLRAYALPSRLELLSLPPSVRRLPPGQLKGYLEWRSIAYAAANSMLLRGCVHFAHATGNRFIENAEALLRNARLLSAVVGVAKQSQREAMRWTNKGRPWVDSSFVLWTRSFLREYFDGEAIEEIASIEHITQQSTAMRGAVVDAPVSPPPPPPSVMARLDARLGWSFDNESSRPFEVELGKAVLRAHHAGKAIAWFTCLHIVGWSGTRRRPIRSPPCAAGSAGHVQTKHPPGLHRPLPHPRRALPTHLSPTSTLNGSNSLSNVAAAFTVDGARPLGKSTLR